MARSFCKRFFFALAGNKRCDIFHHQVNAPDSIIQHSMADQQFSFHCLQRQVTGDSRATFLERIQFQTRADRLGPVLHDVEAQSVALFCFFPEADSIIDHAEDQIVFAAANIQNDIGRASVFVRINDRLP